jgi:hypothetical protein
MSENKKIIVNPFFDSWFGHKIARVHKTLRPIFEKCGKTDGIKGKSKLNSFLNICIRHNLGTRYKYEIEVHFRRAEDKLVGYYIDAYDDQT